MVLVYSGGGYVMVIARKGQNRQLFIFFFSF